MAIQAGSKIGPYEILGTIGAGGMGEVFRAYDSRLGREVALKVLPQEFSTSRERLSRFEQEARSASALNHPNIIVVYDIGSDDSIPYICMELVDGKSLRSLFNEEPIPVKKIISFASQLADGLAKAHSAGIVHRDLKPENLMISKDGYLKILDFGLAKLVMPDQNKGSNLPTETDAGIVLGTVGYMSPEQASGKAVDFRSDQFSFGAILYEMISGRRAFQRATPAETLTAIIREEPEPILKQIPQPLRWILERCLSKDPEDRYASTRDLARDLQILQNRISEITSSGEPISSAKPTGRFRYLIPLLLLITFLAGMFLHRWISQSKIQEPIKFTTLTYSGKDSSPSVSPDGKLIAFCSDRDGKARIWLKQIAGGNEVVLSSGPDDFPRFSPDGSTILFTRTEGTSKSLYRIAVLGGEERKILEDAQSGDWSPDGKQIVFIRWKRLDSILGIASADGTSIRELATIEKSRMQYPRWSPDGTRIVIVRAVTNNVFISNNILIFDLATKQKQWMRTNWTTTAVWSGNSDQILYGVSENAAAYPVNFRASGRAFLQNVNSQKMQALFWFSSIGDILDILDEGKIIFHSASVRENLRQIGISEKTNDTVKVWFTHGNSTDRQPVYSKNGERILFSSTRTGNLDLWEIESKSGALKRITDDSAEDWDPAYTRDGEQIIWSTSRAGHFEIWMMNIDGSGAHQITKDGFDAENPTMTKDGKWIVYNSYNPPGPGVWKIHPDGTGAQRLVPGITAWPEVSPDGQYAAYVWYKEAFLLDPFAIIKVVEISTGKEVPFQIKCVNGANIGGRVRWMPDGASVVYFDQNEKGHWGIFMQDFIPGKDTYSSRRPLAGFDPDKLAETFAISPDGMSITIAEMEILSNLVLVENIPGVSRPPKQP
ncbi:MAG TPA: protein kinase [Acidobacteriota bacterium]